MASEALRSTFPLLRLCALVCAVAAMTGCGMKTTAWLPSTSVAALPGEDLIGPCQYELRLAGPAFNASQPVPVASVTQRAVLVIFERGDSLSLFQDETVQTMASQLNLATMYARECDAASTGDLQADATKGPGRALFAALAQFAVSTSHPELVNANLLLTGFSAGGMLSATMATAYPNRVLGAIPYAPASAYADLDYVAVSPAAAKVPMLILANADDTSAGTQRPYFLFLRGWTQGAPWGFGVQNATGHCCADSLAPVLNPWVTAVMQQNTVPSPSGLAMPATEAIPASPTVRFACLPDGLFDVIGWPDCSFTSASILPSTTGGPEEGWLPDATSASAWLSWVTNPGTN